MLKFALYFTSLLFSIFCSNFLSFFVVRLEASWARPHVTLVSNELKRSTPTTDLRTKTAAVCRHEEVTNAGCGCDASLKAPAKVKVKAAQPQTQPQRQRQQLEALRSLGNRTLRRRRHDKCRRRRRCCCSCCYPCCCYYFLALC